MAELRWEDLTTWYDVVRVNAEFFDQASDHDPQVARFLFDDEDD